MARGESTTSNAPCKIRATESNELPVVLWFPLPLAPPLVLGFPLPGAPPLVLGFPLLAWVHHCLEQTWDALALIKTLQINPEHRLVGLSFSLLVNI